MIQAVLSILLAIAGVCLSDPGLAEQALLPPKANQYLPVLTDEVSRHWPAIPSAPAMGAQVEQESCVSLRSPRCWDPTVELKTDREYGFGLPQITITAKFNNFEAAKQLDPSLRNWRYEDRFQAAPQLRTMVLMLKRNYTGLPSVPDPVERMRMAQAGYNQGMGGLTNRRKLCRQAPGCNPDIWFGNVENYTLQKKTVSKGYGKSFAQITQEYVLNIWTVRLPKYITWFKGNAL